MRQTCNIRYVCRSKRGSAAAAAAALQLRENGGLCVHEGEGDLSRLKAAIR